MRPDSLDSPSGFGIEEPALFWATGEMVFSITLYPGGMGTCWRRMGARVQNDPSMVLKPEVENAMKNSEAR